MHPNWLWIPDGYIIKRLESEIERYERHSGNPKPKARGYRTLCQINMQLLMELLESRQLLEKCPGQEDPEWATRLENLRARIIAALSNSIDSL